ncbi:MAG TPA: hypothetical protein VD790_10215 [Thermoleophilaceae bacterium]|nr:hypothetical protein [Thermoleophilaceae bacterium]
MTATKKRPSISTELEGLTDERWKAHAKVRAIREQASQYDAETEQLRAEYSAHVRAHPEQYEGGDKRPREGTEAAQLRDEIRARRESENPHQRELDKAQAAFRDADVALAAFKRDRCRDRMAEATAGHDALVQELAEAKLREIAALRALMQEANAVREIAIDTEELARVRHVWAQDPRLSDWLSAAVAMRDGDPLARPGLTDFGIYNLERASD